MALTVLQDYTGETWPLGVVSVATPGTPVNIMHNVDPANNNAPPTVVGPGTAPNMEYTPVCRQILFEGFHAGANNNGLVANTGLIYVLRTPGPGGPGAGPGNRSDSGAMVAVVPAGGNITLPVGAVMFDKRVSPYRFSLDGDTAGEGALVTLLDCGR